MTNTHKPRKLKRRLFIQIALLCGLILSDLVTAQAAPVTTYPYDLSTPGDQSAVQIQVTNFASSPREFGFQVVGGRGVSDRLASYAKRDYLLQCLKRKAVQEIPKLIFRLGDETEEFWEFATRDTDPLRVIWNKGAPHTSNQLKWSLRNTLKSIYPRRVHSIQADEFLPVISAWSRTELFMTSLKALSDLTEEQQFILKMMVTAGTTLVIGTGDLEGDEALLQRFIPVGLGEVKSTGGAILEQLPRVSSYRTLYPRGTAYPLINTDGEPIAVESQLGLGRVRLLAVRLNELTPSEVANKVLQSDLRARQQLEEWLDLAMPPLTEPHRLLSDQVWLLLLILPLLFFVAKGRPRIILSGAVIWILLAIIRAPLFAPTSIRRAHMLYIPMEEGAVVLAQVDLNSFDRGGRPEPLYGTEIALLSTETQGACLIHKLKPSEKVSDTSDLKPMSWWAIDSDLGERQRFKYLAYAQSIPRPNERALLEEISQWPPGPWSGASIEPLSPLDTDLPLPADLSGIKAWRLPKVAPEPPIRPINYQKEQREIE